MIAAEELRAFAERFGVPDPQVARDHLISHLLHALPDVEGSGLVFFGGTALCRTHLRDWRLSEDIDLLVADLRAWQESLTTLLPRRLRREYPGLELAWSTDGPTRVARATASGLTVRVQLVPLDAGYQRYPTRLDDVSLRYSDLPASTALRVPTITGAVAMKVNAWIGRHTARDLVDLRELARRGLVTTDAVRLAHSISHAVVPQAFDGRLIPTEAEWHAALAGQMPRVPDRWEALETTRAAVSDAAGW